MSASVCAEWVLVKSWWLLPQASLASYFPLCIEDVDEMMSIKSFNKLYLVYCLKQSWWVQMYYKKGKSSLLRRQASYTPFRDPITPPLSDDLDSENTRLRAFAW